MHVCSCTCIISCLFLFEQFDFFVNSGPKETEVVCVECEGGATGESCDSCRTGYYDNDLSGQSTRCIE